MNRKQRDQNRENALRLSVVVSEHVLFPEYPNAVLAYEPARIALNQLVDNALIAA